MPHIAVEYSKNLEDEIALPKLLKDLHADLTGRETIVEAAIKTYALPISYCEVGEGGTINKMIHVILKLLPGRSVDLKKEMAEGLRAVLLSYVGDCSVTVEVQELEAETYCK